MSRTRSPGRIGKLARDVATRARVGGVAADSAAPIPSYWFDAVANFGDRLGPALLEAVTGRRPTLVSGRYRGKLLGPGSIHDKIRRGDVVWGSGSIRRVVVDLPADATVLALRGPLTRGLVRGDTPEVFGDPAILLPRFYVPRRDVRRRSIALVPHYVDAAVMESDDPAVRVVDVRAPWRLVVEQIVSCDVVCSSSLHGVIVAEAYGVPAVRVRASDGVLGADWKFADYYLGTGRDPVPARAWTGSVTPLADAARTPPPLDGAPLLDALRRWLGRGSAELGAESGVPSRV